MKKLAFIKRNGGSHWVGDGFPVRGIFSYNDIADELSPFLLMDYAGPADFPATTRKLGVGQHPHRGFETVTIVYEGGVSHRDSSGGGGTIGMFFSDWDMEVIDMGVPLLSMHSTFEISSKVDTWNFYRFMSSFLAQ